MKLRMLHTVCKSYMLTQEKPPQDRVLPRGEAASHAWMRAGSKSPHSLLLLTIASQASADPFSPLSVYRFLRRRLE